MQNVAQGTVSDSDKDNSSQNSDSNLGLGTPDKCQTYADLQDKFCTSSGDSDSEEEDISEVESFVLGEGEEEEEDLAGVDHLLCAENPSGLASNSSLLSNKNKFLLGGANNQASPNSVSYICVGDCGNSNNSTQSLQHHHNHTQPQFDPDTQARLVALLEAAVSSSSDPEVLRRLTSSVSSALDEAAAALTRMRTDSASGTAAAAAAAAAAVTVGGSSSSNSCSSSSSTSSSGSNINSNSSSSGDSASSSRSSSTPGGGQRTLVEACTDGDVHTVRRLLDEGKSVNETTEEGESLLALTCSAGYFDLAQVLLAMRANVEDRGIKGDCTPLMEAASAGHVEIVKLLLAHNADVNAQSFSSNTPLMYACGGGHTQVVKVLLEHGAKVEDHNENGHTPLMEAASAGHVQVAKLLLEKGAGINTSSNEFKESALTLACYKGHLEMVKFLLDAGADQEHKTDEMHTALMEASMDGHVEVARLLLDSGAQVNMPADSFESPLTLAACGGHTELALLLLERGANIEEVNDEGYTPLMEAAREGHDEMVKLLIAHNADINAQTEETQETALTLAACGGFKDVAQTLIQSGADLELGASTALMEASQEGHKELVKYLLEVGCNPNSQTSTGDTALTYAAENGHTDVTAYLVRLGANIEHESEGGRTPLMKACRAGHFCTVQYLANQGADINKATSDNDHTPLSLACVGGHVRIVEYLLAIGADPHHKLKDNSTMLMEASKGGHTTVVKVLMDYPNSITHTKANITNEANRVVVEAAVQAEAMGSVLENSSATAITRTSQQALGLSVMPNVDPQKSPIVLNAPNSLLMPDVGTDGTAGLNSTFCVSDNVPLQQQQKNVRSSKVPRKTVKDDINEDARGTAELFDVLKREVEQSHGSREEKQHILEQLRRSEKLKAAATTSGVSGHFSSSSTQTMSNSSSILNSAVARQVLYPTATLPSSLPHNMHTVETQTGFLPTSAWTVLPSGIGISDIASTLKVSNQLSPIYGGSSQQIPMAVSSDGIPIPTPGYTTSCHQEVSVSGHPGSSSSTVYLSPTSPTSVPFSATSSFSSAGNIPVQERRKMVPTKKQLDKKKLQQQKMQPQQQQQLQQHLSSQQQQCLLQQMEGSYGSQASVTQEGFMPSLSDSAQVLPSPLPSLLQEADYLESVHLETEEENNKVKGEDDIDDKETITSSSYECDCPVHDEIVEILGGDQTPSLTALGAPLNLSPSGLGAAPGGNLQFAPTSGIVSSQHLHFTPFQVGHGGPLQYGMPMSVNQGVVQSSSQQATNINALTSGSNVTSSAGVTLTTKPQGKQFLLQPPQVSGGALPSTAVTAAHHQFQQQQNVLSQLPCTNKSKKPSQSAAKSELQQQIQSSLETGCAPILDAQAVSTPMPGMPLDSLHNVMYPNNMTHYPSPSLTTGNGFSPNLQVTDQGLMVATSPKILNDQMSDMLTTQTSQVSSSGQGTMCHYPSPLIDVDSETDSNHDTALTLACAGGHDELVQLLLARGANIEHCDKKGFTPLILAATAGHAKVVETLLNHNANIEAQSERTKETPLCLGCNAGRYEVVEILLARGANKEHRNVSDYTPLSLAASQGYDNIVKLLLEHGAEINSRTGSKLGISPLMLAAMNNHVNAVKLLLDMGSDINAQIETNRNTALTLACFQGRSEVVSLLLDRKANVEHRAKTGLTPLMEAASGGFVDVGKVLIEKGADVNAPPVPSSRDTALTIAADKGHLKFVELLIKNGAQTEVKNKKGNSPMWLAANGGHLEVVQSLLNSNTNINSEDNRKVSCLMSAFKKGHIKLVKFMVRHVSQFPSDQELDRYICTLSDEELRKKCKTCAEIIHSAKEKQAQEANKNANILLDLLEKEKSREETRKASAQRKKQKKKQRKQEKKEEKKRIKEEEEDKKTQKTVVPSKELDEIEPKCPESSKPATKSRVPPNHSAERVEPSTSEDKDGDSGIDSNSQTSASSETKVVEKTTASKKKQKKKKELADTNDNKSNNTAVATNAHIKNRKVNQNLIINNNNESTNVKTNIANNANISSDLNYNDPAPPIVNTISNSNIQPLSSISSSHNKGKKRREEDIKPITELSDVNLNMYLDMKPVGGKKSHTQDICSRVNALDTFGEIDLYISSLTNPSLSNNSTVNMSASGKTQLALGTSPKKIGRREEGWKEVSRKAKRVSVPNNAISRVIGRGGCNINTIREVSGAHIEVEKQGKSQGDRMIIIKGSTEATRQAQNLINALVKDPDKDLSELLPKSVIKVPPKTSKAPAPVEVFNPQVINKINRLTSTAMVDTVTTTTSVYSSAKTGITTVSAWSNIASPKRTPLSNLNRGVSTAVTGSTNAPKSPAVRQLFPGEKKSILSNMPPNMAKTSAAIPSLLSDGPQTFASKLVENKMTSKNHSTLQNRSLSKCMSNRAIEKKENEKQNEISLEQNTSTENNQYSIFNNLISQVTQQVAFGNKDKPLNFARAASGGLASNKIPLGQQHHLSHNSYLEPIENKLLVDASRAPGYRGTCSSSTTTLKPSINLCNSSLSSLTSSASNTITVMKNANNISVSAGIENFNNIQNCVQVNKAITSSSISSGMNTLDPISSTIMLSPSSIATSESSVPISTITSMARSAPGTPVASPSLRPVGHSSNRQTTTPPPVPRSADLTSQVPYSSYVGPSRTPPPIMPSLMRLQVAPPSLNSVSLQSRSHMSPPANLTSSFTSARYNSSSPSTSVSSIASLAPGGPVSSNQRVPPTERNDFVNLAVGQPYRKPPPMSEMNLINVQQQNHQIHSQSQNHLQQQVHHQQQVHPHQASQQQQVHQQVHQQQLQQHQQVHLQQQVQQSYQQQTQQQVQPQQVQQQTHQQQQQQQQTQQHFSQSIAGHLPVNLINGIRFTTPQSNTQPVFTNNILAPISAAPHIQSNLNPNAPDFSSRASFVPGTYPPRTQLTAYQNGLASVTPSIYSGVGLGQFPSGIDSNIQMQPGINDVIGLLPRNNLTTTGNIPSSVGNIALRSAVLVPQDGTTPINSPHSSNPSSPTQSTTGVVSGGTPTGDDRHSKLQPIGTERAQKRSVSAVPPPPAAAGMGVGVVGNFVGGVGGEFLWARQDMIPPPQAPPTHQQVDTVLQPPNVYYPQDLDLSSYNAPIWNWATDANH